MSFLNSVILTFLVVGCFGETPCKCFSDIKNRCHCEGKLTLFPSTLYSGQLHTLSITNGTISSINTIALELYKPTLIELSITRMQGLSVIDDGALQDFKQLHFLTIIHTPLTTLPRMKGLGSNTPMHRIDFESNKIKEIRSNNVQVRADEMFLDFNMISFIEEYAFNGSEISKLSLKGNKALKEISPRAFSGLKSLRDIDLSGTSLKFLPTLGLEELEVLNLRNTETLTTIPSIYDLISLKKALLTYSFHCCAFQFPAKHNPTRHKVYIDQMNSLCNPGANRNERDMEDGFGDFIPTLNSSESQELNSSHSPGNDDWMILDEIDEYEEGIFHQTSAPINNGKIHATCGEISTRKPVECWPKPNVLNPCEDMMSWLWLRVSVWIVMSSAIVGNVAVLSVHILVKTETKVPRLLMGNLAFADLCMAFYLLLLAIMDVISTEVYFNYAYVWQKGFGCRVAGFLTIFASQLSLFTLSIITIERWFAIRRALRRNAINIKVALKTMFIGWVYSLTMAALPLFGISNYSNTSICLPMEIGDTNSFVYVVVLLSVAAFSFFLICFCYIQIYFSLNYETRNRNEGSIAKKMTILVGANFVCWAPIAFFSITAVAGYPLINVTHAKILLVFFYPFNSCANPYIYAILTRQYRKDIVMLLARYGICKTCARKYTMVYSRPISNEIQQGNTAETLF